MLSRTHIIVHTIITIAMISLFTFIVYHTRLKHTHEQAIMTFSGSTVPSISVSTIFSKLSKTKSLSGNPSSSISISHSTKLTLTHSHSISTSIKKNTKNTIPEEPTKILVFGDSLTDTDRLPGGDTNWTDILFEKLYNSTITKIAKYASSVRHILTFMTSYGYSSNLDIDMAIILLGTNDVLSRNVNDFREAYQSIITTLSIDYPHIYIYLMTIPPIVYSVPYCNLHNIYMFTDSIDLINNSINYMTNTFTNTSIIELHSGIINHPNPNTLYECDGIHLNIRGDQRLAEIAYYTIRNKRN